MPVPHPHPHPYPARRRLACLALAVAAPWVAGPAWADCSELLKALEKADRQPRLAQYDIDSRDQPLTGKPVFVRVGKVIYDGFGGDYERHESGAANPVIDALRREQKAGVSRCQPAGSDDWRGAAVTKVRFDNPMAPKSMNPTVFWIARSSGLPVYQEITGLGPGGYAWVYGDTVKEPVVKKK